MGRDRRNDQRLGPYEPPGYYDALLRGGADMSAHLLDKQIGARIRLYRLQRKLSQTQIADQLGVTFQQVQRYEKGTNRVGGSRLVKLCEVLHAPAFITTSRTFSGRCSRTRRWFACCSRSAAASVTAQSRHHLSGADGSCIQEVTMTRRTIAALAIAAYVPAGPLLLSPIISNVAAMTDEVFRGANCDGTLQSSPDGWLTLEPPPGEEGVCSIPPALAARVLRTCQVGQPCTISGWTRLCPDAGECAEFTKVTKVRAGTDRPMPIPSEVPYKLVPPKGSTSTPPTPPPGYRFDHSIDYPPDYDWVHLWRVG
jgi:transcriptional regulator with XRE-family HTH domain